MMADVRPDPDSGAAGTEWQTAAALRELGPTVDTLWSEDLSHRIRHGNLHYLLELPIAYQRAMVHQFKTAHYDVVHVNQPHGYLAAMALRRRAPEAVFVHRSHGFEGRVVAALAPWRHEMRDPRPVWQRGASDVLQRLLGFNNRMITTHADGHIVSATECSRFLESHHGVDPWRIAVIPQAAPAFFHASAPDLDAERACRLLYVGQFAFFKAPFLVARVAQAVLQQLPAARFTWVCAQQHHAEAKALFTDATVLPRVSFVPWQDQQVLRDLYDAHAIFLFPSLFEGFGKAFIEAMTRGLCVVASDNGGMKDVIRHGENGILAETGDVQGMTDACIRLMRSPAEMAAMGSRARQTGRRLTWDLVARRTLDFYERLIELKRETTGNGVSVAGKPR